MRFFQKMCGSIVVICGILGGMQGQVFASNVQPYPVLPNFSHVEEDRDDFHTSPIQNDEEAFIFIKHRMLNRRAEINLNLSKELTKSVETRFQGAHPEEQYANYIINQVVKHTGVPTEGDYLRHSYNFWTISYFVENECAQINIRFNFYVNTEKERMVDQKIKELLSDTGDLGYVNHDNIGDFEKVRAIFRWMTENIEYDYSPFPKRSAYHGLIEGKTICQGFSELFYRLCLELGVDCRVILGTADGEEHAWNIVKIGELYYNMDVTFGVGCKEDEYYHFFLLGNAPNGRFFGNGTRVLGVDFAKEEFQKLYPMSIDDYNFQLENVKNQAMNGKLRDSTKEITNRDSGKAGYNVRWSYENGTLKLSGIGAIYDYERPELVPWNSYTAQINKIVIGNGITHIGRNAFSSTNLTRNNENVSISASVISIAKDAFLNESGMVLGSEPPMNEQYEPVLKEYVALDKNDPLVQAEMMVMNKESDSFVGVKLPKNTKISWESEIDTTTIGKKSAVLLIQYPDGSEEKFTIETIYVRETTYEEPAVQMRISQEPYKTRYIKDVEPFNPAGMIIKLVDKNGNKQTLQADQFEQYGVKFYTDIYQDTELKIGETLSRGFVLISYQDFTQELWLTVEPDGNYAVPEGQDQEWEQGKELVDASIFIKNKYNLPDQTIYKFVKEQNNEVEINIPTNENGIQTVVVCVQYPNGTKQWISAKLIVVSKSLEGTEEDSKVPVVPESPEVTEEGNKVPAVPESPEVIEEGNKVPVVPESPEVTEEGNKVPAVPESPEVTEEGNKVPVVLESPEVPEEGNKVPVVPESPEVTEEENKVPVVPENPEVTEEGNKVPVVPENPEVPEGSKEEIKVPLGTQNSDQEDGGNIGGIVAPVVAIPISQEPLKESVEATKDAENTKKGEVQKEDTKKDKTEVINKIENKKNYVPSKQEKEDVKKAKVTVQSKILYQKSIKKKNTTTVNVLTKKRYKITYSTTTKKIVSVNKRTGKVVAKKNGIAIIKVNFYNQQGKFIGSKTIKIKVKK